MTMVMEPDVADEAAAYDDTGLTEDLIIPLAQLQDVHLTRKTNGATYVAIFEFPLGFIEGVALAGDGHTVYFQGKEIGQGVDIKRIGLSKDADGNRHVKVSLQFPQSEVRKSIQRLGLAVVGASEGELRFVPDQTSLKLTTRAEDDEPILPN